MLLQNKMEPGGFVFVIVTILSAIQGRDGACSFPSHLSGTFDESLKGVLTFTSSQVMAYSLHTFGDINFDCNHQYSSTQYILKSATTISYFSLNWDAYMCWDITEISTNKFYFYEASAALPDAGGEHVKMYFNGATPTYSDICTTSSYTTGTYRFLMRNDTVSSSKVACPYQMEYFWTYAIDTGSGDTCASNDTRFDVCSDTTALTFNYTLCSTYLAYSSSGVVNCLYNVTSGSMTYLTTYNAGNSVDNSATYRYTCMVLDLSSASTIYATQYPRSCHSNQNSTSISSPGASIVFTYNRTCVDPTTTATTPTTDATAGTTSTAAPVATGSLDWVAGVVIGVFVFLVIVIAAYVYCFYNYKKEVAAREKKINDRRALDDDPRGPEQNYEERGQAPPSVKFTFPDYTLRFLERTRRKRRGDRDRLVRKDFDDRPLSPSGISFRDTESPDSALGMDEDDGYPFIRSHRSRPVSDFMKRLINLHDEQREKEKEKAKIPEEKRFMKVHGRQGFKNATAITNAAGLNMVTKIKKMARRRRKTSAFENHGAMDAGNVNEMNQNEANEAVEQNDEEASTISEELPAELDVSQLLAYTALPPITPELPRGDDRRAKAVTIASPRAVNNDVIVEDLDNVDVIGSPQRAQDTSKIYTVGNMEVSPNMKFRREPAMTKVQNKSYLARIHRKTPVRQAMPDIETARTTSGGLRRSAGDDSWGKYLEEIYPDKLYFDFAKGSSSRTESHLRHSADNGLDYLYDRAMHWKNAAPNTRPASRAKSTRSIKKKVRGVNSASSVSRSWNMNDRKLYRDTTM